MKKLILIFVLLLSSLLFARDIYIGDLIKLHIKINESTLSQEEIQKAFDPDIFYLEKIEKDGDSFTLNLRIFEPGLHEVDLRGSIVKFDVKSALKDPQSTTIAENMENNENLNMTKLKHSFPFWILYILLGISIIFSFIYFVIRFNKKKIMRPLTPFQEFEKNISNMDSENFYELLSYSLRKYIDDKFGVNYLSGDYSQIPQINSKEKFAEIKFHLGIEEILKKLDFYKFSQVSSGLSESREALKTSIVNIVKELENYEFSQENDRADLVNKAQPSEVVDEYV